MALKFGAAGYFSLMLQGLVSAIALAHGSMLKALAMVVPGLLLSMVGTDIYTRAPRFTLGITAYSDGRNFMSLYVALFGIAEILRNLKGQRDRTVLGTKLGVLWPSRQDLCALVAPMLRGRDGGADGRRDDHPSQRAGAERRHRPARVVLGHHRVHVDR